MAADVRVDIENDEIVRSTVDDEIRFVSIRVIAQLAKNTAVGLHSLSTLESSGPCGGLHDWGSARVVGNYARRVFGSTSGLRVVLVNQLF